MRFMITLAKAYPWYTAIVLLALLVAGLVEGVGLSLLLPMLGAALNETQASGPRDPSTPQSFAGLGGKLLNGLSALGIPTTIGWLLIVIITCIALKSVLLLLAKTQVGYTIAHIATDLRLALLRGLLEARWEYYIRQPVGSLANAVGTEAIRASSAYFHGAMVISLSIRCLVYSIVAMFVNLEATAGLLVMGLPLLYGLNYLVRKAQKAGVRQTNLLKSLLSRLTDGMQSVKPLKAMAREYLIGPVLEADSNRLNRALRTEVLSTEALSAIQELLLAVVLAIGLYVALTQLGLAFSAVMVLVFLLARVLSQLSKLQRQYQKMKIFESAFWSLQTAISDAQHAQEVSPGGLSPSLTNSLHLKDVTFSYGNASVLTNLSLSIPVGEITAIIGQSGSGKTTIIDLITGLIRPQQGEVYINNIPLETIDRKRWRQMIGYVPQESLLLNDTVWLNVTLGDTHLSQDDVEHALKAAGAWDFVKALPQGVQSSVGERGSGLSGGQRQRIAIARALVHRPQLLILDEITSALDKQSERDIGQTMQQLRGKHTILAISHQPTMVQIADRVYRLKHGSVKCLDDKDQRAESNTPLQKKPSVAN